MVCHIRVECPKPSKDCPYIYVWKSSATVPRSKQFAVNSSFICAVIASGTQFTKLQKIAKMTGLCIPSAFTFSKYVTLSVSPAIRMLHNMSQVQLQLLYLRCKQSFLKASLLAELYH